MDIIRKNRLYIILAILITISLFATSAICSQCAGGNLDELETSGGEDGENVEEAAGEDMDAEDTSETEGEESAEDEESTEEEEESTEEEAEEESTEEEEETQSTLEEPTIELIVYEGPVYSQSDDVCYWRVKATVTGAPTPVVEFNRDDSNGAWGSKKAQINLANPTDSYSLSASATNSEGVATDSISLSWQCNRPPEITEIILMGNHYVGLEYAVSAAAADPDGDSLSYSWSVAGGALDDPGSGSVKWTMPDTAGNYNITVAVDDGNGGHAEKTETVEVLSLPTSNVPQVFGGWIEEGPTAIGIGMSALVGDSTHDKSFRGFLSFDISSLSGKTITSAIIKFENFYVTGDPDFIEKIWLESVDWGTNFQGNDYNIPGVLLGEYDPPTFTCSNDDLINELQDAIGAGKNEFRFRLRHKGFKTDFDSLSDYFLYGGTSEVQFIISHLP